MQKICTHAVPVLAFAALVGCASTHKDVASASYPKTQNESAGQQGGADAMQLPPGWSQADMQACMAAGTPGKQHEMLTRGAGRWTGTSQMWMAPDTQPTSSPMTTNITAILDGHFAKCEVTGEIPGMGPFQGLGFSGFDNVTQKYVTTWFDNHSTGIMHGEGVVSADGKTMTWTFHYTCPITKKPATMREVDHFTGDNAMTMDFFGNDPHSGKEYKMMHMDLTRQSS